MPVRHSSKFVFVVLAFFTLYFTIVVATGSDEDGRPTEAGSSSSSSFPSCRVATYDPSVLSNPCSDIMQEAAPSHFSLTFSTTKYGNFAATCVRERAPVWVDRIYNMARFGYYNDMYFFRVVPNKYVQFGTGGDPTISNIYNWSSTTNPKCGILHPQPPDMPYCMANGREQFVDDCSSHIGLSNTFGTLSMSTNYKTTDWYPNGVTWNATAELFINIGYNNTHLDQNLFVPVCTIDNVGMEETVLQFPSFGEVQELGGDGPSLGLLYQYGNEYITNNSNASWGETMAKSSTVTVCVNNSNNGDNDGSSAVSNSTTLLALTITLLLSSCWMQRGIGSASDILLLILLHVVVLHFSSCNSNQVE